MGIFHEGFSSVSKDASSDYLDRIFVDMMWYKAFALFLILRMNINVLFQDVDLVWFKDPFPYFHNYIKETESKALVTGSNVEGFFSDDGQRSLRYAPFYANSGFYYLKCIGLIYSYSYSYLYWFTSRFSILIYSFIHYYTNWLFVRSFIHQLLISFTYLIVTSAYYNFQISSK